MPAQAPKRGAIPTPPNVLAAAVPHVALIGAPPTFLMKPAKISMWGNDVHGDCVTAEEAFAKACNNPEIFISDDDVIGWATNHGVLDGAYLADVLTWMQNDGFANGAVTYDDGGHFTVDWTNPGDLRSAISRGPVKLGIAADQIEHAWNDGGRQTGWVATGFHSDDNEDHCVSLCGYGSISWLAQELGAVVPAGVDGTQPAYAMFTWNTIGIIDVPSMLAITREAWVRQPTTVTKAIAPVPVDRAAPAVTSWGQGRLDIIGRGLDRAAFHKAWAAGWSPSPAAWEALGGEFVSAPVVESWGSDRLDIFGIGTDNAMWHKAWAGGWSPSQAGWEPLGGKFVSPLAVSSWGPERLDIFGVGLDKAMYHKAWGDGWWPSPDGWESLGGGFTSPPAVCSWGPDRLDIFALGLDGSMWHKAWADGWSPSQDGWEPLGGKFLSPPAVASWGPGRIDIFGIGLDGAMYHKAWENGWSPSPDGWEPLGGIFASPPAVATWGPGRLDIFGVGKDFGVWHKAWDQGWYPSKDSWESIGGGFL